MLVGRSKSGLPLIAKWQGERCPGSRTKEALPPRAFVYLAVMIISWAGNWPLMKLALGQMPPPVFVLLRLIGSLALIPAALVVTRQPLLPVRGDRSSLFWVGQLNRYAEQALEESAARADEPSLTGDDDGAATWRRIMAAVAELRQHHTPGAIALTDGGK